jgi:beta-galactosidase
VPRRRYAEAAQLGNELRRIGPALIGSHTVCDIAVAGGDFDNLYGHLPLSHGLPSPRHAAESIHTFFQQRKHAVGIVHPEDELSGLKVFILPHLALFKPQWLPALENWVADGGTLIIGARSGCKDSNNNVIAETLPGCLRQLAGITVEEYGKQNRSDLRPLDLAFAQRRVTSSLWYESLRMVDPATEVVATWESRHLAGSPAITVRPHGKGRTLYVGSYFSEELLEALYDWLEKHHHLPAPHPFPGDIEVVTRLHPDGTRLTFLIHHGSAPARVHIEGTDLLSGIHNDVLVLQPNEVAIVSTLNK